MRNSYYITAALAALLLLVTVSAEAAAVNPDSFESYTPTTAWAPTAEVEGWSDGTHSPLEITATGGYAGTQGLAMTSSEWPQQAFWHQAPDWTVTPIFTYAYDFKVRPGTTTIYSANGPWTSAGNIPALIETGSLDAATDFYLVTGGDIITPLPGNESASRDVWYTAELECNYITGKGRGRFGPVGGPMNDWTDSLDFYANPATKPLVSFLVQQGHGEGTDFDNFRLTAVPLTPGDATGDGEVNEEDAAILATNWQSGPEATWGMGNFNEDGYVNDIDATLMATNWTAGGTQSTVPEPSLLILCLGAMAAFWLRRQL